MKNKNRSVCYQNSFLNVIRMLVFVAVMVPLSVIGGKRKKQKNHVYEYNQWKLIVNGNFYFMSGKDRVVSLGAYGFDIVSSEVNGDTITYNGKKHDKTVEIISSYKQGKLNVKYKCLENNVSSRMSALISFAGGDLAGTVVEMDGKDIDIPVTYKKHEFKHAREFVFFKDNPLKKFKIRVLNCHFANLRDFRKKDSGRDDFQIFVISSKEGEIELEFDLTIGSKSIVRKSYPGEEYISQDNLHLPDLSKSKNMVQNPGFEGGLTLWGEGVTDIHQAPDRENGWQLDKTVAHTGKKSARYTVAKGYNAPMLCTWPIAVKTGCKYTASFYARTDHEGEGLSIFIHTAKWGQFPAKCGRRIKLTKDWRRYEITFTAPNPFLRLCFGDRWWDKGANDGTHLWLDDVQLETGEKATAFIQKPIYAWSSTGTKNECLPITLKNKKITVNLVNTSGKEKRCDLNVMVKDVFNRTLLEKTYQQALSPWQEISEEIDLSRINKRGILRVVMDGGCPGFQERFYGRMAIYEKIPDPGKTRYGLHISQPTLEQAKYLEQFGVFGSLSFRPLNDPELCRQLQDINWLHIFTAASDRKAPVKIFHQKMTDADWNVYSEWLKERVKPYKDQVYWKSLNEPNCGGYVWTPADCVKGTEIYRKHVKAVNPDAKILSPDPYNASRNGRLWMEQFFEAGGNKLIDVLAIHTYRARPEAPDLDNDIRELKKLQAKYGLSGIPIMFTEGEGTAIYSIPEIGMSPFRGFFEWRLSLLSLDVGQSEIAAASMMARTLLVCLKNSDVVKFYLSWRRDFVQQQPKVSLASINWLLGLLRDAIFREEKVIGEYTRTYLFTTSDNRPVTVFWSYDLKIDRGEKPPAKANINAPGEGWRLCDFMGNPMEYEEISGKWSFPVSGCPVYLIGPKGTDSQLTSILDRATIGGLGLQSVNMKTRVISGSTAELLITNQQIPPVKGDVKVMVDRNELSNNLNLNGKATDTVQIELPKNNPNTINDAEIKAVFTEENGNKIRFKESLRWFTINPLKQTINVDGNAGDWKDVSAIKLDEKENALSFRKRNEWSGPDDLSADMRFGYRDDGLYFCIQVKDDIYSQDHPITSAWRADSLQIYIDLLGDGRDRTGIGYDSNDQTIYVAKIDGKDLLYRDYTPEWQIAFVKQGLIDNGKCAISRKGDMTTYEFMLPLKEIFPLKMHSGTSFGFGIIINDDDGSKKSRHCLVNTPPGTQPHRAPELWPVAVLVK